MWLKIAYWCWFYRCCYHHHYSSHFCHLWHFCWATRRENDEKKCLGKKGLKAIAIPKCVDVFCLHQAMGKWLRLLSVKWPLFQSFHFSAIHFEWCVNGNKFALYFVYQNVIHFKWDSINWYKHKQSNLFRWFCYEYHTHTRDLQHTYTRTHTAHTHNFTQYVLIHAVKLYDCII